MRVLQAAARVVRHRNLEELLEARVPRRGQIGHGQFARDQLLLDLEAQDDVQIVGRLVGLDADVRRLHAVDQQPEFLQRQRGQRGKLLLRARIPVLPERRGCARPGSPTGATAIRECRAKR